MSDDFDYTTADARARHERESPVERVSGDLWRGIGFGLAFCLPVWAVGIWLLVHFR